MNENSVKNKVMDLEYELTMIKLLESDCVEDITRPMRRKSNANAEKSVILDSMMNAFKHFFYENRPVPVRFFREEHREAFMEALRAHRVSLIQAPKDKKILAKNLPHVAEYYVELYGTLDTITFKVGRIMEFVSKIAKDRHEDLDLMELLKNTDKKMFDDLDLLKIELGNFQRSMMSDINQLVQIHRLVAQICDHIAQETQKRYESEEKYSDDGSTIIVSDDEKYNVRQLNSKVDEFLTQKTVLLENFPKLMILADNLYDLKNKLHTKFLKQNALVLTPTESMSFELAKPKIKISHKNG